MSHIEMAAANQFWKDDKRTISFPGDSHDTEDVLDETTENRRARLRYLRESLS